MKIPSARLARAMSQEYDELEVKRGIISSRIKETSRKGLRVVRIDDTYWDFELYPELIALGYNLEKRTLDLGPYGYQTVIDISW